MGARAQLIAGFWQKNGEIVWLGKTYVRPLLKFCTTTTSLACFNKKPFMSAICHDFGPQPELQ